MQNELFGFRIVDKLQRYEVDIKPHQLKYHDKRVMVSKEFTFDSAHHLHEYEGKCKNLHGHTYKVIIGISSFTSPIGMGLDFGDIKSIWKDKVEIYLDHRYLNETLPPMNTTAENIVYWIYEQFKKHLSESNFTVLEPRVEFIRLYETPTSYAEFRREWDE